MAELAWPEDLGHGTFVGRFGFMDADSHDTGRDPDITSATGGTVTITPSIKSVRYSGAQGPMILAARPARGIIDSEGYLCTAAADGSAGDRGVVFPATDDADLSPTDWTYEVSIVLDGQVRLGTFSVKLPEGATVDLSLAAPVPSSGGTAVVVDPTTATRAEAAAVRAEAAADAAEEWTPTFEWDGTHLVVDGVRSPSLKGDTPTWEDLPGKPASYPSTMADVSGLDRWTVGTGWRNLTPYLAPGVTPSSSLPDARFQRIGNTVEFAMKVDLADDYAGNAICTFPAGFRTLPHRYLYLPGAYTGSGKGAGASSMVPISMIGYISSAVLQTPLSKPLPGGSTLIWAGRFETNDAWPTTLPGTPA